MLETNFKVDLNLLLELGQELVSKDEIAISELVKNSYDADATIVKVSIESNSITISDNGTGMSMDTVRNSWLVVGTSFKRRNMRSPKGRRVLGEKGIGRLSAFRLGRDINIRTCAEGSELVEMAIHIPEREAVNGEGMESKYLDSFKVEIATHQAGYKFPGGSTTGTEISIYGLKSALGDKEIDEISNMLSRLIHPLDTSITGFQIELYLHGEKICLEPPSKLKNPPYSIEAKVSESGKYSAVLKFPDENGKDISAQVEGNLQCTHGNSDTYTYPDVKNGGPGPFRFVLSAWDRDAPDFRGLRKDLDLYSGISLMRDNFLIVQPKSDWLGLNMRRVQNPTMRLSTNQIVGAIYISADGNKNLVDKTDREGIIDNKAFECLKQGIQQLMVELEQERYKARRHSKKLSRGNALLDMFDTKPLRDLSKSLPADAGDLVNGVADDMDRRREEIEDLILGRDRIATLGILAAEFIHSGRNALSAITDIYPSIEERLKEAPEDLQKYIRNMVEAGKELAKLFNALDPYMRFKKRRETEIDMAAIVNMVESLYNRQIKAAHIELITEMGSAPHFMASQTDMVILMTNFIVNSIYWVSKGPNAQRKPTIKISSHESMGNVIIEVEDSGPGVPEEYRDSIFELGFSMKQPNGTGIGLLVNSDIVDYYNGKMDLVCKSELGGAKFIVALPLKEVT